MRCGDQPAYILPPFKTEPPLSGRLSRKEARFGNSNFTQCDWNFFFLKKPFIPTDAAVTEACASQKPASPEGSDSHLPMCANNSYKDRVFRHSTHCSRASVVKENGDGHPSDPWRSGGSLVEG